MKINIIIACHDGDEKHVVHLVNLINTYKKIQPQICLVYSGTDSKFPCSMRVKAQPNALELSMILAGLKYFKTVNSQEKKFLKLSCYVWPLDENKIISIFDKLDELKKPYAGNYWHNNLKGSLSTDFFCLDLSFGNIFENVTKVVNDSEVTLWHLLKNKGKNPYIIPERDPVLWNNFYTCDSLKITAHKDLDLNLKVTQAFNDCPA